MIKVWQRTITREASSFPEGFRHVATIFSAAVGDDLESAFIHTQHTSLNWANAPGVLDHVDTHTIRSSMVGDVFETSDGKLHMIMAVGFKTITVGEVTDKDFL